MTYLRAFVIGAIGMGLLAHFVTTEPMPWWPDTAIFGAFMGAVAAFVMVRLLPVRRALWLRRQHQLRERTKTQREM